MSKLKADCYIDQYNSIVFAKSKKELLEKTGYKSCRKMYQDKLDGSSVHVGYVIGPLWFTAFKRSEA